MSTDIRHGTPPLDTAPEPTPPSTTSPAPDIRLGVRPHRGPSVLFLGLAGLVVPVLGAVAWYLGTNDLRAMKDGSIDGTGWASTDTGRLVGKVATIIWWLAACVAIGAATGDVLSGGFLCVIVSIVAFIIGAKATITVRDAERGSP